jgi:hypothetical protein
LQFHQFAAKGFLEKTGLVPYLTTQQKKKPGGLKPDMSCLALAKTMAALKKKAPKTSLGARLDDRALVGSFLGLPH